MTFVERLPASPEARRGYPGVGSDTSGLTKRADSRESRWRDRVGLHVRREQPIARLHQFDKLRLGAAEIGMARLRLAPESRRDVLSREIGRRAEQLDRLGPRGIRRTPAWAANCNSVRVPSTVEALLPTAQ